MPRGSASGRPFNRNNYFEHDNRGESVRRSVTFKRVGYGPHPGGRGGTNSNARNNNRRWKNPALMYDPDVDMGGSGRVNNFSNAGDNRRKLSVAMLPGVRGQRRNPMRGRNVRQGSPPSMRTIRHLQTSPNHWFKITVFHAARYERKWLIDHLNAAMAPDTFTAIGLKVFHEHVIFYLDDFQVAKKINSQNRLKTEDGHMLNVIVRAFTDKLPNVDDNLKETLKVVMARRFRADEGSLDLSRFHADPDLVDKFVPLNQRPILSAVLSLVVENCPSLHALDLSHNHLSSFDGVKNQLSKLVNLRILFLAHNQMTHITSLDPLKGLAVEQLLMDANPLCAKYADQGAYVTDIRKRLPKLLKLDGVDLPPPILFDVETTQLPPSQKNFFCAEEGKEIARQFLEKYYEFYDSPNRENLRAAYHENAMLSISVIPPPNSGPGNREKLNEYLPMSRNLKRVVDLDRRMRNLKFGHEEIMKLLCSLPSSNHDLHSFSVDLILYTPQLIQLCVCGVFRESRASGNVPVRAFNRGLLIVPQGGGFCIVNETLTITNATNAQSNAAFKTSLVHVAPVPSVSAPVVPLAPVPLSPAVGISNQEVETKHQMIQHVVRTTGMNPEFSEKCLTEYNWNVEQALYAFSELHKKGVIPPSAFVPQ